MTYKITSIEVQSQEALNIFNVGFQIKDDNGTVIFDSIRPVNFPDSKTAEEVIIQTANNIYAEKQVKLANPVVQDLLTQLGSLMSQEITQ